MEFEDRQLEIIKECLKHAEEYFDALVKEKYATNERTKKHEDIRKNSRINRPLRTW